MRERRQVFAVLGVIIILLSVTGLGWGPDDAKRTDRAESEAKQRRAKISAEIQKLGVHEWAGDYFAGDGLGVNTSLVLAPASGYVFEWHGCLGLYDRNYGAVAWTNNRIRLSFTFENTRKGFQGIAP